MYRTHDAAIGTSSSEQFSCWITNQSKDNEASNHSKATDNEKIKPEVNRKFNGDTQIQKSGDVPQMKVIEAKFSAGEIKEMGIYNCII